MALDGFLAGLPAGVQIFSLFEANPQLVDLIVDIAGTAPALARYLSRNASVLDAVIGGVFFAPWPGEVGAGGRAGRPPGRQPDYERKLDAARRWMKEWHFRIGVHHLRGLIDGFEAGKQYADLAEAVIAALWPVVLADFAATHGPPPGRGAVVLGMGSLGAGRLNAGSDLDLIVIYDAAGVEASDGKRPLPTRSLLRAPDPSLGHRAVDRRWPKGGSTRSTCACAPRAGRGRWRPRWKASATIRRPRPGPGNILP